MEKDIKKIKELYEKNIFLFKKLLECVTSERESLINTKTNSLWKLMSQKQEIMEAIEEAGDQLRDANGGDNPYRNIPLEERSRVRELHQHLSELKLKNIAIIKENVSFINETVDFFHDIIGIFTTPSDANAPYGPSSKNTVNHSNLIYYNEV